MSLRPVIEDNDDYLSKLIKYIPAEVQALYVFLSGLISSADESEQYGLFKFAFISLMIITPVWIFLAISSGANPKPERKLRIYHSVVSLFAMMIWVYNISMPWTVEFFGNKIPNSSIFGSMLLAIFTMIVPILESIFHKPVNDVFTNRS